MLSRIRSANHWKGLKVDTNTEIQYKVEPIGKIENFDQVDQYVKITNLDDDLDLDHVYNWLREESYYDTNRMGGWFCYNVTIAPNPYHANQCIGIIHHCQNI
jgi:hypothetical protein